MVEGSRQNLTLRLNTERYQALKDEAETKGMSVNALVVQILDEHYVSPFNTSHSHMIRSTYGASSLTTSSPDVAHAHTVYSEGISRLTNAYEDALRKLGGDTEGES